MKMFKKALSLLLVGAMTVTAFFCGAVTASAVSAKDIVAKALELMEDAATISCSYESVSNYSEKDNRKTQYRHGVISSDNNIDYGIYIDTSQKENAWINYRYKENSYWKYASASSFTAYKDSDYVEERGTDKKYLQYALSHLKNLKIASTSEKYYVLTAKPNWKDSGIKKITITISKKSGYMVKYVATKATKTYNYLSSTETYTVTGGSSTYSNICYGDMALSLPDELKGK